MNDAFEVAPASGDTSRKPRSALEVIVRWSLPSAPDRLEAGLEHKEIILCDGAEQLSAFDWHRLVRASRRAGGIVITRHRGGRLPLLHRCETSPQLLFELATSLGEGLSLACTELHTRHDGNIRAAFGVLYDRG